MSLDAQLDVIIDELRESGTPPIAVHTEGTITYVIYGAGNVNDVPGYPVMRVTEPTDDHTYTDSGFLLETDRKNGANGSAADVNLKTDQPNTLLLLINPALIYG